MTLIPQSAVSEESVQEAEAFTDLVKRMTANGERVLAEIDAKLVPLATERDHVKIALESGDTFERRDQARQRVQSLEAEIDQNTCFRHTLCNWQTEFKAVFVTEETDCSASVHFSGDANSLTTVY